MFSLVWSNPRSSWRPTRSSNRQIRLAEIAQRRADAEVRLAVLQAEGEAEAKHAGQNAEAGWYHIGFAQGLRIRKAALLAEIDAIGIEERGARDALAEAFEEQKKYELVAENARVAEVKETARRDNAELDEVGMRAALCTRRPSPGIDRTSSRPSPSRLKWMMPSRARRFGARLSTTCISTRAAERRSCSGTLSISLRLRFRTRSIALRWVCRPRSVRSRTTWRRSRASALRSTQPAATSWSAIRVRVVRSMAVKFELIMVLARATPARPARDSGLTFEQGGRHPYGIGTDRSRPPSAAHGHRPRTGILL